ncbi:MAG: hypothetical protein EOP82_08295, partial [Variovorax sp.]
MNTLQYIFIIASKIARGEAAMDPKSSSDNIHPIRPGRGIQEAQVWEAADVLLQEGLRPTIE